MLSGVLKKNKYKNLEPGWSSKQQISAFFPLDQNLISLSSRVKSAHLPNLGPKGFFILLGAYSADLYVYVLAQGLERTGQTR